MRKGRSHFSAWAIFVAAFWTATPHGAAQNSPPPVGMILQTEGTVTLRRGSETIRAQIAELLLAGDQITTAANSRVLFSFCPTGERVSVDASSAIAVRPAAVQQSRGPQASRTPGAKCALPQVALGKRDIGHIGVLAARDSSPIPLFVGGPITGGRPKFEWNPVPKAKDYRLIVRDRTSLRILWTWEHAADTREVRLPESIQELQPGRYAWELTARADGKTVAQQTANFEVKPDPQLASVQPQDAASQLEHAVALENAGYYAEAAAIYRVLRSKTPEDSRFTRGLIWLYWNAGLVAASNHELENVK